MARGEDPRVGWAWGVERGRWDGWNTQMGGFMGRWCVGIKPLGVRVDRSVEVIYE